KDPPKDFTLGGEARLGNFGYSYGEVHVGDTNSGVGYLASIIHKRFAGHRNLDLEVTDATAKFQLRLSPIAQLGLKLQVYDEISRSTYLGLTREQYVNDPSDNFAIYDVLPVRRYGASATH